MDDTTQSDQEEGKTDKATAEGSLKTSRSGGSGSTSLTAAEIERLSNLSKEERLLECQKELAALLVVYQNLGGQIAGITLPAGREILAHRHILVLPATRAEDGAYSLSVPTN